MSTDMGQRQGERRQFFRFGDRVALRFRVLSPGQLEALTHRFEAGAQDLQSVASSLAATSAQMRRGLELFRPKFPELYAYLEGLNEKVDLMVKLVTAGNQGFGAEPIHKVSLSGSGIALVEDGPRSLDAPVEIQMLLFPEYYNIFAIGRIVRCTQARDLPARRFEIAIEFTQILEADRDLIVHHIMQRQSRQIRQARAEKDATDIP